MIISMLISIEQKLRNIIYFLAYTPLRVKTSEVKRSVHYNLTKELIFYCIDTVFLYQFINI